MQKHATIQTSLLGTLVRFGDHTAPGGGTIPRECSFALGQIANVYLDPDSDTVYSVVVLNGRRRGEIVDAYPCAFSVVGSLVAASDDVLAGANPVADAPRQTDAAPGFVSRVLEFAEGCGEVLPHSPGGYGHLIADGKNLITECKAILKPRDELLAGTNPDADARLARDVARGSASEA